MARLDAKPAMAAVNDALTALGRKNSPDLEAHIAKASEAFTVLRASQAGTKTAINVEKAASTLCGLLVQQRLVRPVHGNVMQM
jgi:hypothetical protein